MDEVAGQTSRAVVRGSEWEREMYGTDKALMQELLCIADTDWGLGHWYIKVMLNGRSLPDCKRFDICCVEDCHRLCVCPFAFQNFC